MAAPHSSPRAQLPTGERTSGAPGRHLRLRVGEEAIGRICCQQVPRCRRWPAYGTPCHSRVQTLATRTVDGMSDQPSNTSTRFVTKAFRRLTPTTASPVPWQTMEAAYYAMLDHLAPVGPDAEISIDERRGAMKGAVAGSRADRKQFAAAVARRTADGPEDFVIARQAIELWQWAYRRAEHNARTGRLIVHHACDGQRCSVTEPFSGIGAAFYPSTDRHIDSSGGAKRSPTILQGHVAGDGFVQAEHFIGVGIGRWVYLRGSQLVDPRVRWPIVAGLRSGSGSPHVRAWLHAREPHRWEPVRDEAGNVSCSTCARATDAGTHATWEALPADAKPQDHPLVRLPRHQWPPQR